MITFKQFITESREQRTKEISVDEAISLMKAHCMDAINVGSILYRGGPQRPVMVGDTALGPDRVSANTFNYYTLFVDNSPVWKGFPKRSRSFIGSASFDGAYDVGDMGPCLMIPYNDAVIGVCPASDFWVSFLQQLSGLGQDEGTLEGLMMTTEAVFKELKIERPTTYAQLKDALKQVTEEKLKEAIKLNTPNKSYCHAAANLIDEYGDTLYDAFEGVLKPTGFTLCTPSSVHHFSGRNLEVFVQGKVIFITTDTHHIKELDKLKEFFDSTNPKFSKAL